MRKTNNKNIISSDVIEERLRLDWLPECRLKISSQRRTMVLETHCSIDYFSLCMNFIIRQNTMDLSFVGKSETYV